MDSDLRNVQPGRLIVPKQLNRLASSEHNTVEIFFKERRLVQRPFPQSEVVENSDEAWDLWQEPTVPAPLSFIHTPRSSEDHQGSQSNDLRGTTEVDDESLGLDLQFTQID